jgi:signal transduction histidine kinase
MPGIKWNLFLSFLLFSAVLLILLWLFQTVLLDHFYRSIKTRQIISTADILARNIDHEDLSVLIDQLSGDADVSIMVLNSSGQKIYATTEQMGVLISRMPPYELVRLVNQTRQAGGSSLDYFRRDAFGSENTDIPRFEGLPSRRNQGLTDAIIYSRIVTRADGSEAVILLNAILSPVSSTVDTLRTQLLIITGILVVLSLLLALWLSRRIARPIIKINNQSRELARGNYQVRFQQEGYKEIAELADTLNQAAADLNKVESLRRELLANVSHDLRTPLTMISGYAEVMRDLPGENTPENIQVVIDESRRLTSLVNDLLDMSRIQSGNQELQIKPYNLTEQVRQTIARFGKLVEQEGYDLTFQADAEIIVRADENRIDQVLHNLINNAVNYTGEDRKVIVRQLSKDGIVRIEVHDSGEGIPAEQMPLIWDRYYKGTKTHRRPVVGTGLGLSIVKSILEQHQAVYGICNLPEGGCAFWFELPETSA